MSHRPGRREREARKRHRRAWLLEYGNVSVSGSHRTFMHRPPNMPGAEAVPLKLGREHSRRHSAAEARRWMAADHIQRGR
jgi:hypothetical protein